MKLFKQAFVFSLLIWFSQSLSSQQSFVNHAYVDEVGVLRWSNSQEEIKGFGVNYTAPFAHAYRMAKRLGISPKEAIKQDVYHFARLDFDLYRVHVWDTEISDSIGNLLENDHLDLFDFMVHQMKQRGMKFVITPIAFWGNGWPEPDEETPGFSHKYGKEDCLINANAIKAQANYLRQFLEHINPYTQIAYKDEADIIAFEISNEPHHEGTVKEVTQYINTMVKAMRKSGTQTPIFYNMSHSIHLVDAYLNANVDGGTFQWYPSGLVSKHALKGNFLPNVDDYVIPFADHPKFKAKAKIVYEFDPADVAGNYMYPAMARSFRKANMQLATHFAYDAMFLAPYNTNYGTHYMNLAYAPQKAISLKIASAVFHDVPMGSDFGNYPENTQFNNFAINQQNDLVELVSDTRFFYSNSTLSKPQNVGNLQEICGYKSSPIIKYNGLGAYFLDQIEAGVWRLELMPDAYWLCDPYEPTSPHRRVAAVNQGKHTMSIYLPQLGADFTLEGINKGNHLKIRAADHTFVIQPGVYILKEKESSYQINPTSSYKNIQLGEYAAPASNLDTVLVKVKQAKTYTAHTSATIQMEVIAGQKPEEVSVALYGEFGLKQIQAQMDTCGLYTLTLPVELTQTGRVNYFINVKQSDGWRTFPSGMKGLWSDWDLNDGQSYTIDFVQSQVPLQLWNAEEDWDYSMKPWHKNIRLKPENHTGKIVLFYDLVADNNADQNLNAFKYYFKDKLNGRLNDLILKKQLVFNGQLQDGENVLVEIGLVDKEGQVFSATAELVKGKGEYRLDLDQFFNGKYINLPRPFPDFLPYYFHGNKNTEMDLSQMEAIQVSIGSNSVQPQSFYLSSIRLE